MKASLAAVAILLAPTALAAQSPRLEALDSVFAAYRGTDTPGCAVAGSRDGQLIAARGYGMSDLGQGTAITPRSVFHIASVSKEFAAMSLVLLAQSGKLSLDDDIRKYLPELPIYGPTITIRHLLTHTSGIRDQWSLLMTAGWRLGEDLITEQDVLDILVRQRGLNFPPGSSWSYSNSGFTLAAIIVKRVTGKSLREFSTEALFQPLGMTRTHFHDDNSMVVPGRTRGYGLTRSEWHEYVPTYSTVGATSLFTTVLDFVQWHREIDEGTVGGPAALTALEQSGVLTTGETLQYALGIIHGTYRGQPTLSHSGGDAGYRTMFLHFPKIKAGVTVFCNLNDVNPIALAEKSADVFFAGDFGPKAGAPGDSVASGALAQATGLYWSDLLEEANAVVLAKGRPYWKSGNDSTPLYRLSDRRYAVGQGGASLELLPTGAIKLVAENGEFARFVKTPEWTPRAADLAALAGYYASDEIGTTWELRLTGDSLTLERRKMVGVRLTATPVKDTYIARSPMTTVGGSLPYVIRASRDRTGKIVGITVGSGRVRAVPFARVATPPIDAALPGHE